MSERPIFDRKAMAERVYQRKRSMVEQQGSALAPTTGEQRLTASEERHAFGVADPEAMGQVDALWAEAIQAVQQSLPHVTDPMELLEEARPLVGLKLYPWRQRLTEGGGRHDDPVAQARYLKTMSEWIEKGALPHGDDTDG